MRLLLLTLVVIISAGSILSQDIQINRQNKTVAITADESVSADAEIAVLEIGYHNYGSTKDAAFQENLRAAERITKAILGAKVPRANIETEKLRLTRMEIDEKWTPEMKKERQFAAEQTWHITVSAADAQAVADLAVRAGANNVGDVEWNVADPVALQAKASATALAKARSVADQMAKGLGTKLGDLVYASNRAPSTKAWQRGQGWETVEVQGTMLQQPNLALFPQKVKSEATVYAVFAIE
jgi:uncharacterized protein YggE